MESSRHPRPFKEYGSRFAAEASTLAYTSTNGDRWFLETGPDGHKVRHVANAASGGHVTEWEAEEFLALRRSGPEHDAVRERMRKDAVLTPNSEAAVESTLLEYTQPKES